MCVNLLGNPNDFAQIQRIASSVDALIIEDNCESLGAQYEGRKTGTLVLWAHLVPSFRIIFLQWKVD